MSRKEEYSIGKLTVREIVDESGSSLLTSNVLASGKTFVGSAGNVAEAKTMAELEALLPLAQNRMIVGSAGGVFSAKTAAEVMSLLFTAAGYYPVIIGVSAVENDADASVVVDLTAAGVLGTDIALACMVAGTTPQAVKLAACTANTLTITLAGNGGVGTQVAYMVLRAV